MEPRRLDVDMEQQRLLELAAEWPGPGVAAHGLKIFKIQMKRKMQDAFVKQSIIPIL